ncbi:MAG: GyrI-like domain-containing protein [Flavobacteriales bacterium]|nr:GyrI-like domain-containing protein [Flavobacteriales bacterium]
MTPRIEIFPETVLIGMSLTMSFAENKTVQLWQSFMPRRSEIKNARGVELFSVDVYNDSNFYQKFSPVKQFEKWAAVAVSINKRVPDGMKSLLIPKGEYAVFHYKGKPSEAQPTFQYIFGKWLPESKYQMADRPFMAIMNEKYLGEHPDSEEEFWVPIIPKS